MAQKDGVTQKGKKNKGGNNKRMPRMSVEDKDDIGNDKSGCL